MKILSVPQDHCESHNDFMTFFLKNYTLYGGHVSLNFGFRLNRLAFRENFEEIRPRLDRLCQIWHIGCLGPMLFRAPES